MENPEEFRIGERMKQYIKDNKLSIELIAIVTKVPLPTLKDKLAGKSSWKISDLVYFCRYSCITLDELVFGDVNYIPNLHKTYQKEAAMEIKEYLIKEKKYKTLGKLTAEGLFDGDTIGE